MIVLCEFGDYRFFILPADELRVKRHNGFMYASDVHFHLSNMKGFFPVGKAMMKCIGFRKKTLCGNDALPDFDPNENKTFFISETPTRPFIFEGDSFRRLTVNTYNECYVVYATSKMST